MCLKVPANRPRSGRWPGHAELPEEICDGDRALGGCDHHRGLHRQPLYRHQAGRRCPGGRRRVHRQAQGREGPPKGEAKPATEAKQGGDEQTDVAGMPASGVKAKGISEKGILEKNAAAEKAVVVEKPAEKLVPAETTASLPADPRRPVQPPRDKTAAKPVPRRCSRLSPPLRPSLCLGRRTPRRQRSCPRRDRAAARQRNPACAGDGACAGAPAHATATAPTPGIVKPLPPPIIVAAPPENVRPGISGRLMRLRHGPTIPPRPTPPAEIPTARPPLDLRAEMVAAGAAPRERTSVAEDMLTATKSMFHAVLPKSSSN